MGPRPRGRGVCPVRVQASALTGQLQWGRARAGAEFDVQRSQLRTSNSASMGPRPRGRGVGLTNAPLRPPNPRFNGAAPARARSCFSGGMMSSWRALASMGPRPRGRGVAAQRPVTTVLLRRFNGAAPARARSFGDACWPWPKAKMLQWGRARAGAELVTRSPFCSIAS